MTPEAAVTRAGSTPAVRLVGVGPASRPAWDAVVASSPGLSVCHLPQWLDCVCEAGPFVDRTRAYRTVDGRLLVLPLVRHRWSPSGFGLYDSWPPYWEGARDSGGLLGEDGAVTAADVRAVAADLRRIPALRVRIVPSTQDAPAWDGLDLPGLGRSPLSAYVVDLTGGFDTVWNTRFSKKARYKSRKAERDGIEVEVDTSGRLLPVFAELYQRSVDAWSRDYFLPDPIAHRVIGRRHPHHKLETVARRLGDRCQIWIARRAGEPVSGIVVLSHGSAATYWKGATDKALVGASGATDLLHSKAIEAACAAGRSRYDLGTSGLASLSSFKVGLGAEHQQYLAYRFERLPLTGAQELLRSGLKRAMQARQQGGPAASR